MPNIADLFLQALDSPDIIKDYKHASRLFVDNNYELSPKYSWLFHVFFDLNPELTTVNQRNQIEAGMLVKSADLPKFRIESKTYNNYNRPSIAQTKVRYEDINIVFHDDSANVVRKMWFDYYNYYYRDMDNNYGDATGSLNPVYLRNNKQLLGQRTLYNKFGFSPRKDSTISNQYIHAIRIYSLHQKRFSEYTLINPVISSFRHGTHQNGQDGTMENSMSISYETVLYAGGAAKVARGFADLHYDKSPSPLSVAGGGTNSILGPGGIVSALDEVITDGGNGNWGSSAFKLVSAYRKNQNVDLTNLAQGELTQAFTNILRGGNLGSALNQTYIPYRGVESTNGTGFQSALATQTTSSLGSVVSNNFNITATAGALTGGIASALTGNPIAAIGSSISGLITGVTGAITGGSLNKVNLLSKSGSDLTAVSSQPIPTNSFTAAISAANERIKSLASAENTKTLQQAVGSETQTLQNAATTFQSGTNNIVQQASSVLNNTPFQNSQLSTTAQVADQLSSSYFTAAPPISSSSGTSTPAAPTNFTI
jgi:hypothetical protein